MLSIGWAESFLYLIAIALEMILPLNISAYILRLVVDCLSCAVMRREVGSTIERTLTRKPNYYPKVGNLLMFR